MCYSIVCGARPYGSCAVCAGIAEDISGRGFKQRAVFYCDIRSTGPYCSDPGLQTLRVNCPQNFLRSCKISVVRWKISEKCDKVSIKKFQTGETRRLL